MAVTDSALIGIIVAGSVAGVILLVVFAIITVYCYRSLDHSSDKKLLRKKKRALLYAETMSGPMYYPETTSSGGTTARLVPPHIPVLYGRYSAATTMEREKHKSKKSHSSHQNSPRTKYGEREEHMEFQDEHQGSNTGSIREDNYASVARESYDSDVPVIVTYLGDPIKRDEETDVKVALDDDTTSPVTTALPDSDEAQTRADPDNDGQTSGEESETDESSEAYRRRQREPPKGDVNPPADYLISGKDSTVLY